MQNHLEIEAKFRVDSHETIEARLLSIDAMHVATMLEQNIFLDTHLGELKSAGTGLRLRTIDFQETANPSIIELTFKGPRQPGPLKTRKELQVNVDQLQPMLLLLEELGYRETMWFEKRRTRWRYEECTIELDQMPLIGRFVEVEGPSEDEVFAVLETLGLESTELINDSYASMLNEYLRQNGIDDRRIVFED